MKGRTLEEAIARLEQTIRTLEAEKKPRAHVIERYKQTLSWLHAERDQIKEDKHA